MEHLTIVQHAGSASAGILDPKASLSHLIRHSFAPGAMYQRAPACRSPIRGHAVCTFSQIDAHMQPGSCVALVRDGSSVQGPRLAGMAKELHAAATAPAAQPPQVGCSIAFCAGFLVKLEYPWYRQSLQSCVKKV